MKTKLLLSMLSLLFLPLLVQATHVHSGYISYTVDAQNPRKYNFVLTLYTDIASSAEDAMVIMNMGDGNTKSVPRASVRRYSGRYDQELFTWSYTYPNPGNYTVAWNSISRNPGTINVPQPSDQSSMYLYTNVKVGALAENMNGARLAGIPIFAAYAGEPMVHNLLAYDADGDRLTYDLIPPKSKTEDGMTGYVPGYRFPEGLMVNKFGELSWENPGAKGQYVIALLVSEWREGKELGSMVVDITFNVTQRGEQPELTLLNQDRLRVSESDGSVLARPNQPLKLDYYLRNTLGNDLPLSARHFCELDTLDMVSSTLAVRDTTDGLALTLTFSPTADLQRQEPYLIGVRGKAADNTDLGNAGIIELEFDWAFTYVYVGEQLPTATEGKLAKAGFKLYPNPLIDKFVLEAPEMPAMVLQLFDATGKSFGSFPLRPGRNTVIKPTAISSGLYFYTISSRYRPIGSGRLVVQ